MKCVVADDALVAVDVATTAFGIFDCNGKLIPASRQYRKNNAQFIPKKSRRQQSRRMDVDAVFMGNLYPHFGHFMLEHLNRAWGVGENTRGMKYMFIDNRNMGAPQGFVYAFMEMLGVAREDVLIVRENTRFRRVIIPAQSFNIGAYASRQFGDAFGRMTQNVPASAKWDKIYVSRAKLDGGKTFGEEHVQRIFERNGFHVIYPETMSLADQVAIMRGCRVLAGCAGTALHLALFMERGGTVIQLKRNRGNDDSAPTQYMINRSRGHSSVFVSASIELHKSKHSSTMPQIIGVTPHMKRFFDDFKFKTTPRDFARDDIGTTEYLAALNAWTATNGGTWYATFKHRFIKIVSCIVPGRVNRGRFRQWLKRVM